MHWSSGREEIYFGHTFTSKVATPGAIPQHAIDVYVDSLRDPAALHASFEYYRTLDESAEQARRWRDEGPLTIPVLAIGGQCSTGTTPEEVMRVVATDVTGLVIPGAGHFLPEEAPDELSRAVLDFLQAGSSRSTSWWHEGPSTTSFTEEEITYIPLGAQVAKLAGDPSTVHGVANTAPSNAVGVSIPIFAEVTMSGLP